MKKPSDLLIGLALSVGMSTLTAMYSANQYHRALIHARKYLTAVLVDVDLLLQDLDRRHEALTVSLTLTREIQEHMANSSVTSQDVEHLLVDLVKRQEAVGSSLELTASVRDHIQRALDESLPEQTRCLIDEVAELLNNLRGNQDALASALI